MYTQPIAVIPGVLAALGLATLGTSYLIYRRVVEILEHLTEAA